MLSAYAMGGSGSDTYTKVILAPPDLANYATFFKDLKLRSLPSTGTIKFLNIEHPLLVVLRIYTHKTMLSLITPKREGF